METVYVFVSIAGMADFVVSCNKNHFENIDVIPSLQFICLVWHVYGHIFRLLKLYCVVCFFFLFTLADFPFACSSPNRIESNQQAIRKYYQSKYIYINFPFDSMKKKIIPFSIQFCMRFFFLQHLQTKKPSHLA